MKDLQHGFRLTTADDVKAAMVPHPDIVNGELCGVDITKRGVMLEASEVRKLREWAAKNVVYGTIVLNADTSGALLGIREVDPTKEPPFLKLGDTYVASDNNTHNRKLVDSRLGDDVNPGYTFDMLQGVWVFADPMIVSADALAASLQHRSGANLKAKSINPDLEDIEVPIMFGLPPQFIDFIDRGKTRSPQDMEFRDPTNFTEEIISSVLEELPEPQDLPKLRTKWSRTLVSASNNIYVRLKGVDVHPSKKQAPTERDRILVQSRFEGPTDLQRLVVTVHDAAIGSDGKRSSWAKTWNENLVTVAIVLRSNAHHDDPDNLVIDWDYAHELLAALRESSSENGTGPFGPAMVELERVTSKLKNMGASKPNEKEMFGCLVNALGQYDKQGAIVDAVWTSAKDRKKARNKGHYQIFGGVDIGAQDDSE